MTPAKRRPATPVSQGPTRAAPDVPTVAKPSPARAAKPKVEPISQDAATGDAGSDSGPPTQTGQVDPETRRTQSRRRPGGLYPLPVWPD